MPLTCGLTSEIRYGAVRPGNSFTVGTLSVCTLTTVTTGAGMLAPALAASSFLLQADTAIKVKDIKIALSVKTVLLSSATCVLFCDG
jgi:hypothetical protein